MVVSAIGPCQKLRRRLADVTDAEREDQPVQIDLAAGVDGVEQLLTLTLPKPSIFSSLVRCDASCRAFRVKCPAQS